MSYLWYAWVAVVNAVQSTNVSHLHMLVVQRHRVVEALHYRHTIPTSTNRQTDDDPSHYYKHIITATITRHTRLSQLTAR
jgi:hypothetical protein